MGRGRSPQGGTEPIWSGMKQEVEFAIIYLYNKNDWEKKQNGCDKLFAQQKWLKQVRGMLPVLILFKYSWKQPIMAGWRGGGHFFSPKRGMTEKVWEPPNEPAKRPNTSLNTFWKHPVCSLISYTQTHRFTFIDFLTS